MPIISGFFLSIFLVFNAEEVSAQDEKYAYIGGYGLLGFADHRAVSRNPSQPTPIQENTDTAGINGGFGIWGGYDWKKTGHPFRTELSATWRYRHDMNITFIEAGGVNPLTAKSNISTSDFMASLLYDLPLGWRVRPYVGGGVGTVYREAEGFLLNGGRTPAPQMRDWDFAWQVQGGVQYAISDRWDFRLDYRYIDMGRIKTSRFVSGDSFSADIYSHDLRVGASWSF